MLQILTGHQFCNNDAVVCCGRGEQNEMTRENIPDGNRGEKEELS